MIHYASRLFLALLVVLLNAGAMPYRPQVFSFGGVSNRTITPNGDGKNDVAVFSFDNPAFSEVTGKVYDLKSAFVADMSPGPTASTLQWDARSSGGAIVRTGVYIYVIESEGTVYRGAVVVIR